MLTLVRAKSERSSRGYLDRAGPDAASSLAHEVLDSSGQPLDQATRMAMESRFGHDFGRVRIHADSRAAEAAEQLRAKAFTDGHHIAFGRGEYAPETENGKRLLQHELAHVTQSGTAARGGYATGSLPAADIARERPLVVSGKEIYRQPKEAETKERDTWAATLREAKAALKAGNTADAERLYAKAIVIAASAVRIPSGLTALQPKAGDIRLDLKMEDFAETKSREVPVNPTNYWRWICFGRYVLQETQAHTESVIKHELVHVRQYTELWTAYQSDPSPSKGSWDNYIRPYSRAARVLGPEELEAEMAGLEYVTRLGRGEHEKHLRSLFVAYVRTSTYIPAKGEKLAATTAAARPQILRLYSKADEALKRQMGQQLWWSLIKVGPSKRQWVRVLRDLRPIAIKGYSDPDFKPHYDGFLELEGLKFGEIIGAVRQTKAVIQRQTTNHAQPVVVPHIIRQVLRSSGQPIDAETRAFMEPRFDHDFSRVRVHTNSQAADSARAVNAMAYTVGQDVVFASGQYAPASVEGKRLLAHELSHVVQQERTGDGAGEADAAEREADRAAKRAVGPTGPTHSPCSVLLTKPPTIARKKKDPRIGGTTSKTKPPYTTDEVKERLSVHNLGPEKGADVVKALDAQGWQIFFWAQDERMGMTLPDNKTILLPRDKNLTANVSTLFHEAMHVLHALPKSAGSPKDPEAVWQNLEEEVMAQYKEILFLKAHAVTNPALARQSSFADEWSWLETANQKEIYDWYRDAHLAWIILGKLMSGWEYKHVAAQFGNDLTKMAASPRAMAILNRVILGHVPKLSPPRPARPRFPSLIKPRRDFRREILESARGL